MKLEYRADYCEDFLCGYYRVHDLADIRELISEVQALREENPSVQFIMTLDDIGQACYTSMHAIMSYDLDEGSWLSSESIDPSWLDGDYLRDDLTFEQRFFVRKLGFKHGVSDVQFDDIFEKLLYLDASSKQELIEANKEPLSMVDQECYLLKVPVDHSYEAIYSFPNGYFSCDLSPFEIYRLAEHLEKEFGLHLFGIGASYLSFIKGPDFKAQKVDSILALLAKIYIKEEDSEFLYEMRDSLMERDLLVLRYTE
jgi:hypothetical protein